jgi:hypothetical protein
MAAHRMPASIAQYVDTAARRCAAAAARPFAFWLLPDIAALAHYVDTAHRMAAPRMPAAIAHYVDTAARRCAVAAAPRPLPVL